MSTVSWAEVMTPLGPGWAEFSQAGVSRVEVSAVHAPPTGTPASPPAWLEPALVGSETRFADLDLRALSPFARSVLEVTAGIAPGSTLTYSQVAAAMGTRAHRAVGTALARNPVPFLVPCHRVVGVAGPGRFRYGSSSKLDLLMQEAGRVRV